MTSSYRYLLRPRKFLTTPKRLAEKLGVEKIYHTDRMGDVEFDPDIDLIMAWPKNINLPSPLASAYSELIRFYNMDKRKQRRMMREWGLTTPEAHDSDKYVKRPLFHHGGNGFEVVSESEVGADLDKFYYAPLFPKTHEYRMIYVCGKLSVILTKQIDDRNPEIPWNHANGSRFVTTTLDKVAFKKMRYLDEELDAFLITQLASIVAYDVMYDSNSTRFAVCEANFAPSLTIEGNIETVVSELREGFRENAGHVEASDEYDDDDYPEDYTDGIYIEDFSDDEPEEF
jgi:hypothetical protein